ncbi:MULTISPECIES: DUF3180 domain-containing protein [Microbacterium]|uniref:DUF3180 domain-containing protein n=1 Tax=Microbacterium TaxID=33882 RepID=UPI0027833E4A|nr:MULTISPECIES: DUF3180 domain-containing protein [Microbacterium]MDQ1082806.1 high-affinity Fe2+/Pb2+ permease [Microbacterium sp. SORGH_AS_0344]MDQ1168424.1 high-affinity Fe2+/Pb2+ permease [Microbacterium proteolyticum]
MRRTGAGILVIALLIGGAAGFILDTVLTAMGRATFSPAASLPTILVLLGVVIVMLAVPVYRAARGRGGRRINPFQALRIAMLAKASSLLGALSLGFSLGLIVYLTTRPVTPSLGSMGTIIATLVCAVILVVAGLVAEQLCTLRKDDDDDTTGNTPTGPVEA